MASSRRNCFGEDSGVSIVDALLPCHYEGQTIACDNDDAKSFTFHTYVPRRRIVSHALIAPPSLTPSSRGTSMSRTLPTARRIHSASAWAAFLLFACVCASSLCGAATAAPNHFKVGLLYPFSVPADPLVGVYGLEQGDLVDMLVGLINSRNSSLVRSVLSTNITLEVVRRNEGSDQQVALFGVIALDQQENVDLVIGADWSACSMLANFYLSGVGKMQISASSTSTALEDRTLYPTFMRFVPADGQQGTALAYLVRSLGWDSVAAIIADDDYAKPLTAKFRTVALSMNITIVQTQQVARSGDPTEQVRAIKQSGAKIILVITFTELAKSILLAFQAEGMATKDYVYIGTDGWLYSSVFRELGLINFQGGILDILPFYGGGRAYEQMLDEMTAFQAANASRLVQFDPAKRELYSPYQAYMYDTVIAVAAGLSKFASVGGLSLPANVSQLYSIMNNITFNGSTGRVALKNGERLGKYLLINHPPGMDGVESFGTVDSLDDFRVSYESNKTIVWGQGSTGTVPSDAICLPVCSLTGGRCTKINRVGVCVCFVGWKGEACSEAVSTTSSSNIVTIVAAVVAVCGTVILGAVCAAFFAVRYARKMASRVQPLAPAADPALDLDGPIAKAMKVIENIRHNRLKGEALTAELKIVEDALIANNMYQPELEPITADHNIGLETVQFLDNLLMTRLMPDKKMRGRGRRTSAFKDQSMASVSVTVSNGGSMSGDRGRGDGTHEATEVSAALEHINRWDFNMFDLETATMGHPLCALTFEVMFKLGLFESFAIDPTQMKRFLLALESGYMNHNAVYHTSTHAADVLQAMFVFFQNGLFKNLFSPQEMLAACLACVAHVLCVD
eukprot:Opistho-2@30482